VCDDHNTVSGDGCSADCKAREIVGYRITSLVLKYPHVFFSGGCNLDLTSTVNGAISDQLTMDGNGDGKFDLSPVIAFKPYDTDDPTTPADIVFANCLVNPPAQTPQCSGVGVTGNNRVAVTATNTLTRAVSCLTNFPIPPAPTRGYTLDAITSAGPPLCFASTSVVMTLSVSVLGTPLPLPLEDVRIAAVYSGSPAT